MSSKLMRGLGFSTWLQLLIVVVLVLGVFFRFVNLDKKVYWIDETYTSLRVAGYTEVELVEQVFDGNIVSIEELQKYQEYNPEKNLGNTISSLALESPQHPPLYYVMARFWVKWWGNSIAVRRSLSALISLFVFPCVYWLCIELFKSPLTGWIAIAFIAVSPFHILYAQEAREYSLWTVMILLSSAALLYAIRVKSRLSWAIYTVSLALGLYSFIFYIFVVFSHALYVIITERLRLSKTFVCYFIANVAAFVCFSPWLLVIYNNLSRLQNTASWTEQTTPFNVLVHGWIVQNTRIFFDLNTGYKHLRIQDYILLFVFGYAIYFLVRTTPKQIWLFILTLIGVTALALAVPDLISGGMRSVQTRYLIPCYLGIHLAVVYLLTAKITFYKNIYIQKFWQILFVAIITGGIITSAISSQAELWWNKSPAKHKYNPEIATIINQAITPLLISDDSTLLSDCFACRILSLSYSLLPKVKLQLVIEPNIPNIPNNFTDVFLFSPSQTLKQGIEKSQNYQSNLVFQQDKFWLWKLTKN